ncbi:hypothetical protein DAPPUDRAFT_229749 [Daphnia pulex]|uniref:FAS1 domain-containing protein n=1 Tax=Daphnia pulex TaxID=6669 RepID=E9HU27_DAPPU|nr:hypothetical protein DAPPUDRAFT_229749 [Daphnia pulex]|eukprot:EFX64752.1 hypothetical protein DAPPUDRAFT_229749 [Daphnia pulex]
MNSPVAFLSLLLATACLGAPAPDGNSVMDLLLRARQDRVSTLVQALQTSGLADTLQKDGPFTLFAPVNDAFKSLPEGAVAKMSANPADLKKLLLRHVFKGSIAVSDLKTGDLANIDGGVSKVVVSGPDNITIDGAKVYTMMNTTSTTATNGVIYYIDKVILPTA